MCFVNGVDEFRDECTSRAREYVSRRGNSRKSLFDWVSRAVVPTRRISRYTGGLVGDNANGEIKWSYATGVVTGHQDVGGLVGQNKSTIKHAYATKDDLLAEASGDKITLQHIIRYMSKPGADVNGDGTVDAHDISFLLRQISPFK